MAKKTVKKTKTADAPVRGWNQSYEFVKDAKVEPVKDTIIGTVYAGIKKVKRGTIEDVTDAALKAGLGDATGQNPRVQTQVMLRRLIAMGVVKLHKETAGQTPSKDAKAAKGVTARRASAVGKKASKAKGTPKARVRLVKGGAAAPEAPVAASA